MSEDALNCEPRRAARGGGRAARVALRAAPLAENMRPVRAGLPGGQYKPLTEAGVAKIHAAALDALEVIGLSQAPASGVEIMTGAGAILGDDGRLRFPRALVEDMLAVAARDITLHGRDPKHDLHLSGTKVHFGTAGAAVHIVDLETNTYRDSTAQDLFDAARITHHLDNVHFFQRAMVCRDVLDNLEMDLNTLYACCSGTSKHVGTSFSDPSHVEPCFDMIHRIAGGEEAWRARPFISNSNCFVVPPMKFAEESCITMEKCIRGGMPVLAAERRAGRRDGAGADRARHRAGGRGMPRGRRLCQRDGARSSGDLRHLALRRRTCAPARCRAARPSRRF